MTSSVDRFCGVICVCKVLFSVDRIVGGQTFQFEVLFRERSLLVLKVRRLESSDVRH